jgi:hypothetical protein
LILPLYARAEEPRAARRIVVLTLGPGAAALDAEKIRASIGADLDADVVPSADPRAANATGQLEVDVAEGEIVVTFRAIRSPVTRTLHAPDDPAARARSIVVLAGNLARDEAHELLAELPKKTDAWPRADTSAEPKPEEPKKKDDYHGFVGFRGFAHTRTYANIGFVYGVRDATRAGLGMGFFFMFPSFGMGDPDSATHVAISQEAGVFFGSKFNMAISLAHTSEIDFRTRENDNEIFTSRVTLAWQPHPFVGLFAGFGTGIRLGGRHNDQFGSQVEGFVGWQVAPDF